MISSAVFWLSSSYIAFSRVASISSPPYTLLHQEPAKVLLRQSRSMGGKWSANTITPSPCVTVLKVELTESLPPRPDARISVSLNTQTSHSQLIRNPVWYGKHRNRGFISPATLKSLGDLPFVEDRWKLLASQLGAWKKQDFDIQK